MHFAGMEPSAEGHLLDVNHCEQGIRAVRIDYMGMTGKAYVAENHVRHALA